MPLERATLRPGLIVSALPEELLQRAEGRHLLDRGRGRVFEQAIPRWLSYQLCSGPLAFVAAIRTSARSVWLPLQTAPGWSRRYDNRRMCSMFVTLPLR